MKYLLDVNLLIAAIWQDHPDHSRADKWVMGHELATCPISELGFLRVSTHPKSLRVDMTIARSALDAFLEKHQCAFVNCDLPALKAVAKKSDEVTDSYLAELAGKNKMKLATLDTGIIHPAVEVVV